MHIILNSRNLNKIIRFRLIALFSALAPLGTAPSPTAYAQASSAAPVFYSQGDPSNDEQYILELINRARMDPAGEGRRLAALTDPLVLQEYAFFAVNTAILQSDFASYTPKPPLAMNPSLMAAARRLGLDEGTRGFQGHTGSDGSTTPGRLADAGYLFQAYGENTFTMVESAFFSHAAFNVDWGVPDLAHRQLIMNLVPTLPTFREIGVSLVPATVPKFGPLVVSHEFGLASKTPFATGVVYTDNDHDGFYTPGEGTGGVRVSSPQSGYNTTTGAAGGYSLPLNLLSTADSAAQIVFDNPDGTRTTRDVALALLPGVGPDAVVSPALANVKVDVITVPEVAQPLANVSVVATKNARSRAGAAGKFALSRKGGDTTQPLTVTFTLGGSAVSGRDYRPVTGTATFAPGSAGIAVKIIPTSNPDLPVSQPRVKLKLRAGSGYQFDPNGSRAASLRIQ